MNWILLGLIVLLMIALVIGFIFVYLSLRVLASKINRNRKDLDDMLTSLASHCKCRKQHKELDPKLLT